ncbi:MAG: hypothetical protein ABIF85_03115 [Nanoarchaeota archaeon]|nr:hypothetical protein [Nanoarchaeota archaeon]MBU4300230.1 hypothetical protein [Nanoarchaeota archaeon]MBU4451616.1 hypothetical protein [Nanoarchaeota archaeon]MCG2723138.1 hypothetical protein [archaeon]
MGCKLCLNERGYKGNFIKNGVCPIYFSELVNRVNHFSEMVQGAADVFADLLNCPPEYTTINQYLKEKDEFDGDLIRGIVEAHDSTWQKAREDKKFTLFLDSNPALYHNIWQLVCDP